MTLKEGVFLLLALSGAAAGGGYAAPESVKAISEKWELSAHANGEFVFHPLGRG